MGLQEIVADLIAKNQDFPSAEDVAKRMGELYLAGESKTFPALTFRPEEWRMSLEKKSPFVMTEDGRTFDVSSRGDLERVMAELDREDEIMSAVRAVARGE